MKHYIFHLTFSILHQETGPIGKTTLPYSSFNTCATPVYIASAPQTIPSYPARCSILSFLVACAATNRKNNMVNVPNTSCSALFSFNVPKNSNKVNMPHIAKYASIEASVGAG